MKKLINHMEHSYVLVHMGPSSGDQTKAVSHKTKLPTFVYIYTTTPQINVTFYPLDFLHHFSCVQMWLIWFYTLLLCCGSLIVVCCRLKQVGMFSVIL